MAFLLPCGSFVAPLCEPLPHVSLLSFLHSHSLAACCSCIGVIPRALAEIFGRRRRLKIVMSFSAVAVFHDRVVDLITPDILDRAGIDKETGVRCAL